MSQKNPNTFQWKSIRLGGYDYRNEGVYFITICTEKREHYFGECSNGNMQLNAVGSIAHCCWNEIPDHFPNTAVDEFVVMPNHLHGILIIREKIVTNYPVVRINENPKNEYYQNLSAPAKSVSTIIRAFKSAVTSKSKIIDPKFKWQSRFYDAIIRSQSEYWRVISYINQNPVNWKEDRFI